MNRIPLQRGAAFAFLPALLLVSSAHAEIYRCTVGGEVKFQDWPCGSTASTKDRVIVQDPGAIKVNPDHQDAELAAWLEKAEAESRQRELEIRLQVLERENQQTQAEFAVMMEQLEEQKKDAAELRAETPPTWVIEQQQQKLSQEHAAQVQDNAAQRKLAREALQEEKKK